MSSSPLSSPPPSSSSASQLSIGPPVWSDKRQALCDALPYFKSHQGGMYTSGLVMKGFLIDGEVSIRDMLTSNIIITSLGGGKEKDANGRMKRTREASLSPRIAARTAMKQGRPIGVIAGNQCPLFENRLQHTYSVLGWFTITDMWAEKDENDIFLHKLRLEKTDKSSPDWWTPTAKSSTIIDSQMPGDEHAHAYPQVRMDCESCHQDSPQIFTQGWVCLNGKCESHLLLDDGKMMSHFEYASTHAATIAWCTECRQASKTIFENEWTCLNNLCAKAFVFADHVNHNELVYSDNFLKERTQCRAPTEPLQPPLPDTSTVQAGTGSEFRIGLVCPKCHGCSRRKDWDRWVYETEDCDFVLNAPPQPYSLASVADENAEFRLRKMYTQARAGPSIISQVKSIGAYGVKQYLLPAPGRNGQLIGSVHVLQATAQINAGPGGPDELWEEIQRTTSLNFDLKRNPVRTPGHKTEVLTRHFQQNWGAPYKFVVNVLSRGFSDAPDFILKALMRMDWAGRQSVAHTEQDAHDRGTKIKKAASESLDRTFTPFNELLSLGYMEGDCISYHDDGEDTLGPTVATLSLGSPAVMAFRLKKKYDKNRPQVLQFPICHGDIVVMHGAEIHKYYEHKVEPKGKRRFALTSRHIVLDRLNDVTRAEAEAKGSIPERASKWQYDGQ